MNWNASKWLFWLVCCSDWPMGEWLNHNEIQQLDNIASDLGFNELDEKEFRY